MKKDTPKDLPAIRSGTVSSTVSADQLLGDIRSLIEGARQRVAQAVNAGLVMLYWSIGNRVCEEIGEQRAK